jgi:hypothetical protein
MSTKTLESELNALLLAFDTRVASLHEPLADNVKKDFDKVISYNPMEKTSKHLIWGLLIGRSVDTFTVFFLNMKHQKSDDFFNRRIERICGGARPLTRDPTIKVDLDRVKDLRNELFHNSDRQLSDSEIEDLVFKSARSIQQLIRDI